MDVNGKSIISKEINEVTDLVRLFTSPNRGMKPANGIIRAVTIIANEEYGMVTVWKIPLRIEELPISFRSRDSNHQNNNN